MKTFKLFLTMLCCIVFFSCQNDEKLRLEPKNFLNPVLEIKHKEKIIIDENTDLSVGLIEASWSASNYGLEKLPIKYTLELDTAGNKFSTPTVLATTERDLIVSITAEKLKEYALSKAGESGEYKFMIELRIKSSLSDDSIYNLYSNVLNCYYTAIIDAKGVN